MKTKTIAVLDVAPLSRRGLLVLELDWPIAILGVRVEMMVTLTSTSGSKEEVRVTATGLASSVPDHAHLIVTAPTSLSHDAIATVSFLCADEA